MKVNIWTQCCGVIFIFGLVTCKRPTSGQTSGVIPTARCRARCLSKFQNTGGGTSDENSQDSRYSCWSVCESLFSHNEAWDSICKKRKTCSTGCQVACKFWETLPKVNVDDSWHFTDTPAVLPDGDQLGKGIMAWSAPVSTNTVPANQPGTNAYLVYVLLSRDRDQKDGKAWQQTLQTSSTGAVLEDLSYNPEFWLLAVGEQGTVAQIRFNSTALSDHLPYLEETIVIPGKYESRHGDGAVVEYDDKSTLNITMDLNVYGGRIHPNVTWVHPAKATPRGQTIGYRVDWYLNNCRCTLPSEHFGEIVYARLKEMPSIQLPKIAFSAEYLVEIEVLSNRKWKGKIKFYTPNCPRLRNYDATQCDIDIDTSTMLVKKATTSTKPTAVWRPLEVPGSDGVTETVVMSSRVEHRLDWNITNIELKYQKSSNHVFAHVRWALPFSHEGVEQTVLWQNMDHSKFIDAGIKQHVVQSDGATSEILTLKPGSTYNIWVQASYNDTNGVEHEARSNKFAIDTNNTSLLPQVLASRKLDTDREKDILSGLILSVAIVASIVIFGIIVVFIYKKRQSFRDIIITKTAVSKCNSYKSNVGGKADYSNQVLLPTDEWEVDCRQLKFASHIGQGAFGKVITGYYHDQRVAIKLVRDEAPISYKEDLLCEIYLMKRLGSHKNIVSMIGACTLSEPIALVMEFVPYGNLQNFLKKCRMEGEVTVQAGRCPELNYSIMDDRGGINEGIIKPSDMLSFARQVAMAMEYLAEKKYVHRDLAARNVLLGYDKVIKVCDFGLSRDIYNDNQYKKLTNGKLPLKWMAVESLRDRVFTTFSDVWSFGILLWEIVTMGASPYPNIALADLFYLLSNNYRMDKPSNCSDELYIIMRQCWQETPTDRPDFTHLREHIETLLTVDRNYLELDNINVPLSTPDSSSGSPVSDDTASLLAAQALQPQRKSSKDELTVNMCIHDQSVETLLKKKGEFDAHNITIL